MKQVEKLSPRLVWTLGWWVVGPASEDVQVSQALTGMYQGIFNRRPPAGSQNEGPFALPGLDWMGLANTVGTGIQVERRGVKALRWGRFHSSDAINVLTPCRLAPGSAVVAAAWSPRSVVDPSSQGDSSCAYLLMSSSAGTTKQQLMDFPNKLKKGLVSQSDSVDDVVVSCLASSLDTLKHTGTLQVNAWQAFHRESLLNNALASASGARKTGRRF